MGYAPVDNPQIVVLVLYDEAVSYGEGVGIGARVFKEIMLKTLPYMGIQPVDAIEGAYEETVTIPDFTGKDVYEVTESLAELKLDYEAIGIGKEIKNQYPKPGVVIPVESSIKLYFTSSAPEECLVVPDLIGETLENSQGKAAQQGFVVETQGQGERVLGQIPKAAMKVEKGSTIKLILTDQIIEEIEETEESEEAPNIIE